MSGKLSATIPKDMVGRKFEEISVGDLKEILKTTGLSRIQPFLPEKKKYEIEVPPYIPPVIEFPRFNEKKKSELELPPELINFKQDKTIEDILDYIENEYKKAAIEVDDLLDQISKFEENHFERLGEVMNRKSFL